MAINLQVVADVPAELAPIWDQLRGDRAQVDIRDDDMFIVLDLRQPTDPTELLCDLAVATVVDDSGEEIEWVGCRLLKDHDGPHFHHEFGAYDDEGNLAGSGVDEPEPDSPLLDETTDPHEPERQAAQADEPPTLRERVLATVNGHPDRTFTLAQIYEHLEGENQGSVAASVQWLVSHDRIRRIGRGQYQALDRTAVHDARRQAAAEAM
jgi:hypothetical protein